jgi:predicted phage terminase large subunit-like protein
MEIRPQPGMQEAFLSSPADILIAGGAAGAGKTFATVIDPLRYIHLPGFDALIMRRQSKQITNPGGLWTESSKWYPHVGAVPREFDKTWKFPAGSKVSFAHAERMKDAEGYQGAQIGALYFDEVTHFEEEVFWYMISRNRTTCGMRPTVRATCNPDPDSFVRHLIDWWIGEDGFPIPERGGVLRWFLRLNGEIIWGDSKEELCSRHPGSENKVKSFTFLPGSLEENKVLMDADPGYKATLEGLPLVERMRLLMGNWNIRAGEGKMFNSEWFTISENVPEPREFEAICRSWDQAGTAASEKQAQYRDWTVGVLMGRKQNRYYVLDVVYGQWSAEVRDRQIARVCEEDWDRFNGRCVTEIEQQPGSAGKDARMATSRTLARYPIVWSNPRTDKVVRAKPLSAATERRDVILKKAAWNVPFMNALVAFPNPMVNDDMVDAASGAFNNLVITITYVPPSYSVVG